MRFLANENFPKPVIQLLRERGHDVLAVAESLRGADDHRLLETARTERRVLITFDKDFGELAFRARLPAECGVILFRLSGRSAEVDNARAVTILESTSDWAGHFTVVTDARLRMRSLLPSRTPPNRS